MKKLGFLLVVVMVFMTALISPRTAVAAEGQAGEITVLVDGLKMDFDVAPVIQNDRVMLPFRKIAEDVNVEVNWDAGFRKIVGSNGKVAVTMFVDNKYAWIGFEKVELDASPVIIEDRTLIPARFFTEAFGCEVDWNPDTRMVKISSPAKIMQVTGFYALGDQQSSSWTDLFATPYPGTGIGNTGMINKLALGWYSLDENGSLLTRSTTGWQRPDSWEKVVDAAEQYNLDTEMVVHITDGEGRLVRFLSNPEAVKIAVESIAKEAVLYNGVNLDFEGLGWNENNEQLQQTRASFNNFATLLVQELKRNNRQLILTLHAPNSAYLGYDYATLGKVADYIIIMAYDYGSKPEPAGMIRQAVEMAKASVPASKLLLGISVVGENPDSLQTITGIAKKYNLGGIALWRLGLLNSDKWKALGETVTKSSL
ncbi:MAG: stalk domain-containing protein [Syntrophomonadaceae bacterium]|nr:stalk domain-containing protein [Syntrophomonadaceae bacterium]